MYIDTHSHVYSKDFHPDFEEVVSRAKAAGVNKILLPNIDLESFPEMMKLNEQDPNFFHPMLGLHPCDVKEDFESVLRELKSKKNVGDFVAVGEIGIDLYWDKSTLPYQQKAFATQIQWALDWDLPFVIHARDSFKEIFEVMDQFKGEEFKGVFHCFTGNEEELDYILSHYPNMYIGLGGVFTFKNTHLRELVKEKLPLDKIVIETDAPYLAPHPNRGKRNEPAFVVLVAQALSNVFEIDEKEVGRITSQNATELFRL